MAPTSSPVGRRPLVAIVIMAAAKEDVRRSSLKSEKVRTSGRSGTDVQVQFRADCESAIHTKTLTY